MIDPDPEPGAGESGPRIPPKDEKQVSRNLRSCVLVFAMFILLFVLFCNPKKQRARAMEAASRGMISSLDAALTAFHSDYGVYPEDEDGNFELKIRGTEADFNQDGSPKLINGKLRMRHLFPPASIANRPKARPYFILRDVDLDSATGVLLSPFGKPFHYREWLSKPDKTGAKNRFKFDLWTNDADTEDEKDPARMKEKTRVNNWD